MKRTSITVALLMALVACDDPKADADANGVAGAAQIAMKPGLYEIEYVREVMVPGQPGEPIRQSESQCFSASDLAHPGDIFIPTTERCTKSEVKVAKGDVTATMVCRDPELSPSDLVFQVHGTYGSEGAELAGETTVPEATLRETRSFKRQGDC